jgi:hypothetical protein
LDLINHPTQVETVAQDVVSSLGSRMNAVMISVLDFSSFNISVPEKSDAKTWGNRNEAQTEQTSEGRKRPKEISIT